MARGTALHRLAKDKAAFVCTGGRLVRQVPQPAYCLPVGTPTSVKVQETENTKLCPTRHAGPAVNASHCLVATHPARIGVSSK